MLAACRSVEYEFAYFTDETGKRWYDLGRIAKSLGIARSDKLAERIPEQHKKIVNMKTTFMQVNRTNRSNEYSSSEEEYSKQRGNPNKVFVDDAGMYRAIMKSDSPKAEAFTEWVTAEVIPNVIRTGSYSIRGSVLPKFIQRFAQNQNRTENGYFSVIGELGIRLWGKLEGAGYIPPDNDKRGKELRPDVSVGKLFASYLHETHPEHEHDFKPYLHQLPNGREIEARQYKLELLPVFIQYVDNKWIKERAYQYFLERDPKVIEYLPKLIPGFTIPQLEKEEN